MAKKTVQRIVDHENIQREYVSVAEAARLTSLSGWTLRHWAYEGKIESVKIGSRLLLPVEELRRVLAEHTRPAVKRH